MRALDRPLLADENISPDVVSALRQYGRDVQHTPSKKHPKRNKCAFGPDE